MFAPRVILVRPQSGENIGLVVRLCANYALPAPAVVAPEPGWERDAARTASMCRELLATCRLYETLSQACANATRILGFTARPGRERRTHRLTELTDFADPNASEVALVFGNERTGLDEEECSFCTELFRASLPGLSSLNLSHAVATVLHECFRDPNRLEEDPLPENTATLSERERLIANARETLTGLGYRTEDPHFEGALRRLLRARALERRDARILHKVLTHLDHVREHGMPEGT